jgi:hypothetical protein
LICHPGSPPLDTIRSHTGFKPGGSGFPTKGAETAETQISLSSEGALVIRSNSEARNNLNGKAQRLRLTFLCSALAAFALFAWAAPASQAGVLVSSATNCDDQTFEQPFLPWADVANYVLAPDGTFEQDAGGWSLAGGASLVSGNESFHVHGSTESSSLSLPAGAKATSGSMCVGIEHPTLRVFARNSGAALSALKVEVLFEDATGTVRALTIGRLTGGTQWQPSIVMPVVANLLPLLPGERTAVAFGFSAQNDGGSWQIDDTYVDPYRSR